MGLQPLVWNGPMTKISEFAVFSSQMQHGRHLQTAQGSSKWIDVLLSHLSKDTKWNKSSTFPHCFFVYISHITPWDPKGNIQRPSCKIQRQRERERGRADRFWHKPTESTEGTVRCNSTCYSHKCSITVAVTFAVKVTVLPASLSLSLSPSPEWLGNRCTSLAELGSVNDARKSRRQSLELSKIWTSRTMQTGTRPSKFDRTRFSSSKLMEALRSARYLIYCEEDCYIYIYIYALGPLFAHLQSIG